jgi:hypothetical protein
MKSEPDVARFAVDLPCERADWAHVRLRRCGAWPAADALTPE